MSQHPEVVNEENDPLVDWDQHLNKKQRQTASELARYLEEDTFTRTDDFNILQWWRLHSSKYPILSYIARGVLVVQASVVSLELTFITRKRLISDYRSRLCSETVEALICLQDWFRCNDKYANTPDQGHYY